MSKIAPADPKQMKNSKNWASEYYYGPQLYWPLRQDNDTRCNPGSNTETQESPIRQLVFSIDRVCCQVERAVKPRGSP